MLSIRARRSKPELVAPARATPLETKNLSDMDDYFSMRSYGSAIELFRCGLIDGNQGPAKAIKAALSEALVYYYPVAGRLRETLAGKLVVECTGEGVVFVEAEADVRIEELGQPLLPPYPCESELLCDAGDMGVVVGKPLFFIQVTRLGCGGFVIGFHMNHNIADGFGAYQFLKCVAELARGEARPSILPIWERQLLTARVPPRITDVHPAYEPFLDTASNNIADDVMLFTPSENMVLKYFLFDQEDMAILRINASAYRATSFELITAVMWRCRTAALGYGAHQRVRLLLVSSLRASAKKGYGYIPQGYYGNAVFHPIIETTVDELCGSSFGHTLELLGKAKLGMSQDQVRSLVDMMVSFRGQSPAKDGVYPVSDLTRLGQDELDFGWGKRIGGAVAQPKVTSFHMKCRDGQGRDAIVVSMYLPTPAMGRFASQLAVCLKKQGNKSSHPAHCRRTYFLEIF